MQVMAGSHHGGAEAFFMRLAPALAKSGVTQRIVIRRDTERAAELTELGLAPLELPFANRLDIATMRKLRQEVENFEPEVVLGWMSRAVSLCQRGQHVLAARLGGYYNLKYYKHCDYLVGNTLDICDYILSQGWPTERTWYLPNFVHAEPAPAVARSSLTTPEDAPLILAMGRLHENKAFDVLLHAVAQLDAAWLWIAGEGPEADSLASLADHLGVGERVRFLGWRNDTAALLAACDVLACPSRHEPLGNVVIEGWAHGKPVVAAASQGPSVLIETGRTGLLVPRDDADALAEALKTVLQDRALADDIAAAGEAAYLAQFTEDQVVERYWAFFNAVRR